jgi:hypothetical protein
LTAFFEQTDINPPVGNFIGETCKATFENNVMMYMEVVETVPLTVSILIKHPEDYYTVSGYHKLAFSSDLLVSHLKIRNLSKYKISINDKGTLDEYEFTLPDM